jgi:hypothetical protein
MSLSNTLLVYAPCGTREDQEIWMLEYHDRVGLDCLEASKVPILLDPKPLKRVPLSKHSNVKILT